MTDQSKPREPDRDTEQRILQAARVVFIRHGTAGARMQEIADEAGVNQALLHYYFRSKSHLAQAVFKEAAGRLIPAILEMLGSDEPLERKIERFVHLYIDTVRQHPFLPGYILAEVHHHPERMKLMASSLVESPALQSGRGFLQRLQAQLDAARTAGRMREIAAEQFLVNLLSVVVFPFVARPILEVILGLDDEAFGRFLDARRAELPGLILSSLRP